MNIADRIIASLSGFTVMFIIRMVEMSFSCQEFLVNRHRKLNFINIIFNSGQRFLFHVFGIIKLTLQLSLI